MAGTMSGLSVGVSGLQRSQSALNTTAHNLSNVNTEGYTRQQVLFGDSSYSKLNVTSVGTNQIGIGVDITEVRRIRDEFLDKEYRKQLGRTAFYEAQYEAENEVENALGELNGENFGETLNSLWTAFQEIDKMPGDSVYRASVVENAVNFVERSKAIYEQLEAYQQNLNEKVKNTVDRINELAQTIYDMNKKISSVESAGVESANDYRDTRDAALDELSSLIKISYNEAANGVVDVLAEGVPLVYGDCCLEMSVKEIEGTTLLKPVWDFLDGKDVFNLEADISTAKNNDIGELKSLLLARGDGALTYLDLQGDTSISMNTSLISSSMAIFDQLVNGIVTKINDILCPNKELDAELTGTAEDGSPVSFPAGTLVLDTENASYDTSKESQGTELFARSDTERYQKITGDDGKIYYVYNVPGEGDNGYYTCKNLTVREELQDDTSLIPLTLYSGEEDRDRTKEICDAWDTAFSKVGNETTTEYDFIDFYSCFANNLGNIGATYKSMADSQTGVTTAIDDKRQGVAGVSSDDELTNMIKFQNAYNAASRYINVVSEMIEHIVTQLGNG